MNGTTARHLARDPKSRTIMTKAERLERFNELTRIYSVRELANLVVEL
jgi:hypothetical protein